MKGWQIVRWPPRWSARLTVQHVLSLLLAATVVPMLAGGVWIMHAQWRAQEAAVHVALLSQARTLVAASDREFAAVVGRLRSAAASELIDSGDWAGFHRYAQRALADWPGALLAVTAPDGQLLVNSGVDFGTPLPNLWQIESQHGEFEWQGRSLPLSSQGMTRRVFETGQAHYSNIYMGANSHRPTLAVAVPAGAPVPEAQAAARARAGQAAGRAAPSHVVTMSFPPTALQHLLERAASASGLRAYMVDRNGVVVATNGRTASQTGDWARETSFTQPFRAAGTGRANAATAPLNAPGGAAAQGPTVTAGTGFGIADADAARAPDESMFDMPSRDGTQMVGAWARSQTTGYRIVVALPREQAYAAATRSVQAWGSVIGGVALLGLLLSGLLAARLRRGLHGLARLAALPPQAASAAGAENPAAGAADAAWSGRSVVEIDFAAQALRAAWRADAEHRQTQLARRLAEEHSAATAASEERLRRVVDRLFAFVGILDTEGRLIEVNEAPLRAAALSREEVLGQHFHTCAWWTHDAAVSERVRESVALALQGQTVRYDETIRVAGDGRIVIDFQLAPLREADGSIGNLVASGVDVTPRVRAVAQAQAERGNLDALLDAVPAAISVCDASGRLLRVNGLMGQLWGSVPEHTESIADFALWRGWWADGSARHGQPLAANDWALAQALMTGEAVLGHIVEIAPFTSAEEPPAQRLFIHLSAAPVRGPDGQVTGGVAVMVDITERMAIERALREADRNKDEFIATLAHELRNPLAPIRASAEVIRLRQPTDPEVMRCAQIVLRQSAHLARLVDDLLDASRLRMGPVALQRARIDLRDVAATALEAVRPGLQQAGHRLQIDLPGQALLVDGDATRLAQVLGNLLHNACKFTPSPGQLALRLAAQDGQAVVTVTDNGCGIAPVNLERVFELFTQEQPSGLAGRSGLGIGLALAKRLVEMHGGRITAHSEGATRGSTFVVRLPMVGPSAAAVADAANSGGGRPDGRPEGAMAAAARAASARAAESGSAHPLGADAVPVAAVTGPAPGTQPTLPARQGQHLKEVPQPLSLLVVDDNVDAAESLAELLRLHGHATRTATSGMAALAAWQAEPPEALLLDIGLPDLSGYELARRIRASQRPQAPPLLVALTGWGQAADRKRAREAGFDHHLTKPTDLTQLLQLLEAGAAQRNAQRGGHGRDVAV